MFGYDEPVLAGLLFGVLLIFVLDARYGNIQRENVMEPENHVFLWKTGCSGCIWQRGIADNGKIYRLDCIYGEAAQLANPVFQGVECPSGGCDNWEDVPMNITRAYYEAE